MHVLKDSITKGRILFVFFFMMASGTVSLECLEPVPRIYFSTIYDYSLLLFRAQFVLPGNKSTFVVDAGAFKCASSSFTLICVWCSCFLS